MSRWTALILLSLWLIQIVSGAPPAQAAPLQQTGTIHVVQRGQTLFSIARRYGTSVDALVAANALADPTHIYAGQRLVIPLADAPATSTALGVTHAVQPGENLFRIALRYGTTVEALTQLNGIYNPGHVVAGQTLRIPGSATAPTPGYQPDHAAQTHTVQPGETLSAIAYRHGISIWTLAQANDIANPALILPGQTLRIPHAGQAASPPTAGNGGKRIVIDLSEQHLYAYQGGTLVYSFVASTGMPGAATQPGTYSVLDKYPNAYASTWNLQMPHWLGIYWAGTLENGIHALPIMANGQRLWAGYLGTPVSYGCVILGVQEAAQLYEWAQVGTPVIIQP
jgi:LysM repeat protein